MIRISITGPESTGKSSLAEQLASHFDTIAVPEIARQYLNDLGRNYTYEDIAIIAKKQLANENELALQTGNLLICDTDLLVNKVWSHYKFNKCDPWIEERVISHRYDLYLLCDIDLPWEYDPLREHPDKRKELFAIYRQELTELEVNFRIISGTGETRLKNAINAVLETFDNLSI